MVFYRSSRSGSQTMDKKRKREPIEDLSNDDHQPPRSTFSKIAQKLRGSRANERPLVLTHHHKQNHRNEVHGTSGEGSWVGSVSAYTDKGRTDTSHRDYKLGDIIYAPHVVPCLDPSATLDRKDVGFTESTGPVIGKMRPAIVVGIFERSLTCLPMLTCGGKGPINEEKAYSLRIRNWWEDGLSWEGVHESEYLVVGPGTWYAKGKSHINLKNVFSVQYSCPIDPVGSLTHESWQRLRSLWIDMVYIGFKPAHEQERAARKSRYELSASDDLRKVRENVWGEPRSSEQYQFVGKSHPASAEVSSVMADLLNCG